MIDCLFVAALLEQDRHQITADLQIIGLGLQGVLILFYSLLQPSLLPQRESEVIMRFGEIGRLVERELEFIDRLIHAAKAQ